MPTWTTRPSDAAIISRLLESRGYRVGIIAQPDWKDPEESVRRPRAGPAWRFLVTAGNMDSMVNHYSVSKKTARDQDAYTPGGVMGKRPDYAVTVATATCSAGSYPARAGHRRRESRPVSAALRHYDYWSGKSPAGPVLLDSQADLVTYGMGEHSIVEIADALERGHSTCYGHHLSLPGLPVKTKELPG